MVQQLDTFAREVKRVARDVGVSGIMGGQAAVDNVQGRWREITEDVVGASVQRQTIQSLRGNVEHHGRES